MSNEAIFLNIWPQGSFINDVKQFIRPIPCSVSNVQRILCCHVSITKVLTSDVILKGFYDTGEGGGLTRQCQFRYPKHSFRQQLRRPRSKCRPIGNFRTSPSSSLLSTKSCIGWNRERHQQFSLNIFPKLW